MLSAPCLPKRTRAARFVMPAREPGRPISRSPSPPAGGRNFPQTPRERRLRCLTAGRTRREVALSRIDPRDRVPAKCTPHRYPATVPDGAFVSMDQLHRERCASEAGVGRLRSMEELLPKDTLKILAAVTCGDLLAGEADDVVVGVLPVPPARSYTGIQGETQASLGEQAASMRRIPSDELAGPSSLSAAPPLYLTVQVMIRPTNDC